MDRDTENTPRRPDQDRVEPKLPADVVRDGHLKASIWRNESEKGPFYATTFNRTYRDDNGEYRDSSSFIGADLLKLAELAHEAYTRTNAMRRDDRQQARSREGGDDSRREAFRAQRSGDETRNSRDDRNR